MRVLVISECIPDRTAQHGVFQRLQLFSKAFDRFGDIEYLFFVNPHKQANAENTARFIAQRWEIKQPRVFIGWHGEEPGTSRIFADYLAPILGLHRQAGYARLSGTDHIATVQRILAESQPDLLFIHRLGPMSLVLRAQQPTPPILFDLDDVEHKAAWRKLGQPPHWMLKRLFYLHLPALWLGERAAIQRADRVCVCSPKDRRYLEWTMQARNLVVVPNSASASEHVAPPSSAPPTVLFIGNFSYPPNVLAADRLVREVWPSIRSMLPQARLIIAGARPEQLETFSLSPEGVEFTGFVEDLDALYARTRVVCTPIRNGSGTRIKIIEAAMYGRPVVSTTIGAEGLAFAPEHEILIADHSENMARFCIELLNAPVRCDVIGQAAKRAAHRLYGRDAILSQIENVVRSLVEQHA